MLCLWDWIMLQSVTVPYFRAGRGQPPCSNLSIISKERFWNSCTLGHQSSWKTFKKIILDKTNSRMHHCTSLNLFQGHLFLPNTRKTGDLSQWCRWQHLCLHIQSIHAFLQILNSWSSLLPAMSQVWRKKPYFICLKFSELISQNCYFLKVAVVL